MDSSITRENRAETGRVRDLARRLSLGELQLPLNDGWTVSAALAHLAFWDRRALVLLTRWKSRGPAPSAADTDVINDSILPLCLAIEPRRARQMAVQAAEAVDRALEGISAELAGEIERLGSFRLRRYEHRREHREEIERAVAARPARRGHGETL
jgi:hypothetical protein